MRRGGILNLLICGELIFLNLGELILFLNQEELILFFKESQFKLLVQLPLLGSSVFYCDKVLE